MTGPKRLKDLPFQVRHATDEDYERLKHWHIAPFYRSGKEYSEQAQTQSDPAVGLAKERPPIAPEEERPEE